jgi:hypothetical protein
MADFFMNANPQCGFLLQTLSNFGRHVLRQVGFLIPEDENLLIC